MSTLAIPAREVVLQDYLAVLSRRRVMIGVMFLLTVASVLIFSLRIPPQYRTSTTLVVETQNAGASGFAGLFVSGEDPYIATLGQVLTSRTVTERIAQHAGLDPAEAGALRGQITVERTKGTGLVSITVVGQTPDRSAKVANAAAEALTDLSLTTRRRVAVAIIGFLEQQLVRSERAVRYAEETLLQFKAREGNISIGQQVDLAVGRWTSLQQERAGLGVDRQLAARRIQEARKRLATFPKFSPAEYGQPLVAQLRGGVINAEIDLATLRQRYTDEHPLVIAAQARVEELSSRLRHALGAPLDITGYGRDPYSASFEAQIINGEVELILLQAHEQATTRLIADLDREIAKLPPKELAFTRLQRDLSIAESAYLQVSQRLQEARIAEAGILPDIQVVDRAETPGAPFTPNVPRNVLLGGALGLVLAVAAAFGADYTDRSVRTTEEVERVTGLPVLAVVPALASRVRAGDDAGYVMRDGKPVGLYGGRRSLLAEVIRGLRTSLLFTSPDAPLRTVMITSALPSEGKTSVAVNLALSFAQLGRNAWLVECDLRKPALGNMFKSPHREGLTDYLVGAVPLERALQHAGPEGIEYIQAGSVPPNPAELIGSQKMRAFLSRAREQADLVILDSPPLIPVTDGLILGPQVDGVILVVEVGRTPREALQEVQRRLAASGARVLGVVLSKVPAGRGYGYYSGYYSYGYGHYGYGDSVAAPSSEAPRE